MLLRSSRAVLTLFLFTAAIFCANHIFAAKKSDIDSYQGELEALYQSISKIQGLLKDARFRRGHVITELRELEMAISDNARQLSTIDRRVKALNRDIKQLKNDLSQLHKKLQDQRQKLAEQVRAAYTMGRQQHIKMLLNQQDPAHMGQIQVYFDYMNRAREHEIEAFLASIRQKSSLEHELDQALAEHKKSLVQQREHQQALQAQRTRRKQLLTRLDSDIQNQEQTLSELEHSRDRIENLLMSLGELLADIPARPGDQLPFAEQKGRLPWPVNGPFLASYGADKNQGGLKWKGVLIGAPYGTPVRAISHGRVAFSDWLQGFGFITIIDHGDGYMSLYGHNESLLKKSGDWVNAGEVIATSGDSGGHPNPGLYFEIRSRGKPVNPDRWCSS